MKLSSASAASTQNWTNISPILYPFRPHNTQPYWNMKHCEEIMFHMCLHVMLIRASQAFTWRQYRQSDTNVQVINQNPEMRNWMSVPLPTSCSNTASRIFRNLPTSPAVDNFTVTASSWSSAQSACVFVCVCVKEKVCVNSYDRWMF